MGCQRANPDRPFPGSALAAGAGPTRSPAAAGFALADVLLAAFILAVGLLGLARLQVAGTREWSRVRARVVAAGLAEDALESALADARRDWTGGTGADAGGRSDSRTEAFDRDGLPAGPGRPCFTVTLTRSLPPQPAAEPGPLRAWLVQAAVVWTDGDRPRRLVLARLVAC